MAYSETVQKAEADALAARARAAQEIKRAEELERIAATLKQQEDQAELDTKKAEAE